MITTLAENQLFQVSRGSLSFSVAFMPGTIAVYGLDVGKQYFKNPEGLKPKEIKKAFPDEQSMLDAAVLHRVGAVNSEKMEKSLSSLVDRGLLTPERRNVILQEVLDCDCSPAGIRRRLHHFGFGDVLSMPGFEMEDRQQELKDTVKAFKIFIEEYQNANNRKYKGNT